MFAEPKEPEALLDGDSGLDDQIHRVIVPSFPPLLRKVRIRGGDDPGVESGPDAVGGDDRIGFSADADVKESGRFRAGQGQREQAAIDRPDAFVVDFHRRIVQHKRNFSDMAYADMPPSLEFTDGFDEFLCCHITVIIRNQPELIGMSAKHISRHFGKLFDLFASVHLFPFPCHARLDPPCSLCYRD